MEKGVIFCLCAANLGRWIPCQNSFKKNFETTRPEFPWNEKSIPRDWRDFKIDLKESLIFKLFKLLTKGKRRKIVQFEL
jgi:hypothetical protein